MDGAAFITGKRTAAILSDAEPPEVDPAALAAKSWEFLRVAATHAAGFDETGLVVALEKERDRAAGGAGRGCLVSSNDDRDAFIYDAKANGRTHGEILAEIKKHKEWSLLDSEQGVGKAADRYAKRRGLAEITSKNSPKKPAKKPRKSRGS